MDNNRIPRTMIKANGVWLPDPRVYGYQSDNLYIDSGRNTLGYAVLQIIRKNLKKITLEWHLAGYVEDARELSIIAESFPIFFDVEFIHPSGERRVMRCYKGAFSADMSTYWMEDNGRVERWQKIAFNFVEQ